MDDAETIDTGMSPKTRDADGKSSIVCIAENRPSCEPALRILVQSLEAHCPGLSSRLYCPNASSAFVSWMRDHPMHQLVTAAPAERWTKYDIKPLALLALLNEGYDDIVWLDSDILVARDFRDMLRCLPEDTLAVSEEALCSGHADPDGLRARLWGMAVGRVLPFTVNTGVVRVTRAHVELLRQWNALLQGDLYRDAQAKPWNERGLHVMGDQEVLTALLSSAGFAHVPVHFIRRGRDIIQYFGKSGYTVGERLRHMRTGLPFFVHSQGFRPWWPRPPRQPGFETAFEALYNELSPYSACARRYASPSADLAWANPRPGIARFLTAITGDRPTLSGMPLAAVADLARAFKWMRRRAGRRGE